MALKQKRERVELTIRKIKYVGKWVEYWFFEERKNLILGLHVAKQIYFIKHLVLVIHHQKKL